MIQHQNRAFYEIQKKQDDYLKREHLHSKMLLEKGLNNQNKKHKELINHIGQVIVKPLADMDKRLIRIESLIELKADRNSRIIKHQGIQTKWHLYELSQKIDSINIQTQVIETPSENITPDRSKPKRTKRN